MDHQSNPRLRRVIWNLGQSNWNLKNMKNRSFEVFCISKSGMQGEEVKRICHEAYSWWQLCQPLLENFIKSNWCMLYVISKLRKSTIQCFKQCTIRSWNEEVAAIASQSLLAEGSFLQSVAKSPFCCEVISQPFCTVWWISSWSCPIYATSWKLRTSRWKPTSQPYENNLLPRSDFAALFICLRNLADIIFSCEMVLSASRYLLPTLGDIFHQIFVV